MKMVFFFQVMTIPDLKHPYLPPVSHPSLIPHSGARANL